MYHIGTQGFVCLYYTFYGVVIRCLFLRVWVAKNLGAWEWANKDSTLFLCRSEIGISSATQNTRSMSLHIGQRIKEELERQGHKKSWLAQEINRSRTVCYNIFNKPTIDTELLSQICQALNYDFFKDLSEDVGLTKTSEK